MLFSRKYLAHQTEVNTALTSGERLNTRINHSTKHSN